LGDAIQIGPSYHDRVFELFERLDKGIEGTGVGLALVKRIVELHGGKIWVSSEGTDRGTTFHFTFPLRSDGEFDIGGQMVAVFP
jgi:signal transduction histidine kinase